MEDKKKIKIVLIVIFVIIVSILILYFINITKIGGNKEKIVVTNKTTTTINNDYKELTNEEKVYFNNYFNDTILIALNNSIYDKLQTFDENLFQREESKFRFIYSYLVLNNYEHEITIKVINEYSNKFFKTSLDEENLKNYLVDGKYYYGVYKEKPYYCLKAAGKEKDVLVIDMISYDEVNCNKDTTTYDEKFILNKLKLNFEIQNEELIFKSIKIEGKNK